MKRLHRSWPALAAAALLAGCASLAPTYERPALPVAQTIGEAGDASVAAADAPDLAALPWREVFVDARLQKVIATALSSSRSLRESLLDVEKARAQYRIQSAELLPSVAATASQTRSRSASGDGNGGVQAASARTAGLSVGFTSWELDLFGRVRSLRDEALQSYLSLAETARSARISLIAEVAGNWLTVGAYAERLALARETLESQRKTLALTQARHAIGVASAVDVSSVQTSVESARSDVASYAAALEQARHALELSVGAPVAGDLLPLALGEGVALKPLPVAVPSSVLLQRPDVLAAERTLQGAHADIGAARAAFFPSITLSASAGRGSDALASLFDAGTHTWSFAPSISVPIFNAGSLKASLDAALIQKNIYVAQYEKAIQTAFSEVADALSARAHVGEQLDAQQALVAATQASHTLTEARWRHGVNSYLEALDAQRSLYSARQTSITLRLSEASNRVTLYKVLGGGAE